ncbi:phosphopantetheine-binding protein [Allonocardiopsis opalescens]|uniref:Phosphopantetheine binding protein n=1 Tax=Allonocardiopsis opalescens TaxID=1144618 RepID=A0A2T0QB39_9ACTN|nr:phosphopantetheine-binding protein [Allonocardiopsis opalescens]PRY01022.1 phosphopantetheine binding protein [Allonocardiopsis opalescens]
MLDTQTIGTDVRGTVIEQLRALLSETLEQVPEITGDSSLHELGMSSLLLARLLIQTETVLDVDPFADGDVVISDIRTVDDLVKAYENALSAGQPA